MAKRKGLQGMSFEDIMWQQAAQSVNNPIYCRFCGKNVKEPSMVAHEGMTTWDQHLDWEIENHAHVSCARKAMRKR